MRQMCYTWKPEVTGECRSHCVLWNEEAEVTVLESSGKEQVAFGLDLQEFCSLFYNFCLIIKITHAH